ncbi:GNAT family N-acetyltransferase [Streptomyces otsuchiensis]|uniref:GNAT family N-acetyltransferase n=1 Tax=Streptomyces otsuchiensis TaxID=2681388 RepID=UPI00102F378D|nr:GNAT family N-acetyltransferase [Streptomyces otsuchiensis]
MSTTEPSTAVEATQADVPAAVETLARAFADYPLTRHVVAADRHQERVRGLQRIFLEDVGMRYGRVWVAGGGDAVAVWTTPEADPSPGFAAAAPLLSELVGDRAAAFAAAEEAMEPHRPTRPTWFLATVGVRPAVHGRGLGTSVLLPGLRAAREAGLPAFLETSAERNVRFYRRLGFEVTAEVELPGGGPKTWCMLRTPETPETPETSGAGRVAGGS